eukprot:TRINITY_DN83977_c0_g1_i1.p1 TRINITY_DN83977_c0_g1~~TRINITY_DN83977_c0_g1_i1.p1  ORF type:complete len:164 (-),score=28.15 TRINITY_DN83977_c0_g1_i1:159-605(-)
MGCGASKGIDGYWVVEEITSGPAKKDDLFFALNIREWKDKVMRDSGYSVEVNEYAGFRKNMGIPIMWKWPHQSHIVEKGKDYISGLKESEEHAGTSQIIFDPKNPEKLQYIHILTSSDEKSEVMCKRVSGEDAMKMLKERGVPPGFDD